MVHLYSNANYVSLADMTARADYLWRDTAKWLVLNSAPSYAPDNVVRELAECATDEAILSVLHGEVAEVTLATESGVSVVIKRVAGGFTVEWGTLNETT